MKGLWADAGSLVDEDELDAWRAGQATAGRGAELPPEEPPAANPIDENVKWEEPQVRSLLKTQGRILHRYASGGSAEAWIYTRDDLDSIAEPLCRILNRYPVSRAMAAAGDELAVFVAATDYAFRSMRQRGKALAEADEALEQEQPFVVTGTLGPDGVLRPS